MKDNNYEANFNTFKRWIEEASGGFLTAEISGTYVSVYRTDGKPWYIEVDRWHDGRTTTITGYLVDPYIPRYARLDRRNRQEVRRARDAVRRILVDLHKRQDPDLPDDWVGPLSGFERRNHLV